MAEFWVLLSKMTGRPSLLWRLAWLIFCLLVLVLFGARTLQQIIPSVVAGASGATPPDASTSATQSTDFGLMATWILPALTWLFIATAAAYWLLKTG